LPNKGFFLDPADAIIIKTLPLWSVRYVYQLSPLALTVEKLRSGEQDLVAYVDEMCDRLEELDSQLEAMLRSRTGATVCDLRPKHSERVTLFLGIGRRSMARLWP